MSTLEEMEDHADEVLDTIALYLIDSYLDQTTRLLEVLEERLLVDLDLTAQLRRSKRLLTKFRDRNF